jgi:hypothetical protein
LCKEARCLFSDCVDQDAGIVLRDGRILYVELFTKDDEIILRHGWYMVLTIVGADEGDSVFFTAGDGGNVQASFFDPLGCDLIPSSRVFPQTWTGDVQRDYFPYSNLILFHNIFFVI